MTPRLNISLTDEDKTALLELKHYLEKSLNNNLSLADVVRKAIHYARDKQIRA